MNSELATYDILGELSRLEWIMARNYNDSNALNKYIILMELLEYRIKEFRSE